MIIECSDCRAHVPASDHGSYERHYNGAAPESRYTLLRCDDCGTPILIRQTNVGNTAEGDKWDRPHIMYPSGDLRVNPNAPVDIQTAFDEACSCYSAGAFTASAIMCRKTLEGISASHGVKERNLAASLKKMKETGQIDARLFEWSDLLRVAGNEAAHGTGANIGQPDAKDMLEFTNAIMDYLFSFRDRFEKFKDRRAPKAVPKKA